MKPETRQGVAYHLPYSRFNVAVTRTVAECKSRAIDVLTAVELTPATAAPDLSQAFTIDNNSLNGVFRIGAVKAEYGKAGIVKSFNATADDRTGQVISAIASGAFKIASLVAPIPEGAAPQAESTAAVACSPDVIKALAGIKAGAQDVQDASARATAAAEAYQAIQARVTALGGIVDGGTRTALVAARVRSEAAAADLVAKKRKLDKLKEVVTHVDTFVWPPDGSIFNATRNPPSNLLALWKNPKFTGKLAEPAPVLLVLQRDPPSARVGPLPSQTDPVLGLPYRIPLGGKMLACEASCDPSGQLAVLAADVLQLGPTYYLPCQSQTFGSTACTFTADENGVPTAVGTEQKTSAAETAATLTKDLAAQYSDYKITKRDAQKVAYEAETARLKAKAEYEKALAALQPNSSQSILDATATYKAYADYYAAMKAYEDAKAAAPATPPTP